ncbi:MAG: hypothetical protein KAR20_22470, partial [Candidatus Heimdallarchaeota archaeon]|nr:hypothetical protein [Candidatus Heimdallarchaeota archaeon]
MQKIFKFSTLTVVLFIGLLITGCGTTANTDETTTTTADSDKLEGDTKSEPVKTTSDTGKPETVSSTAKKPLIKPENLGEKLDADKAYKVFIGSEEELYAKIKYPGYWRLTKIPGMKSIPGIEKLERWCKFRFESLDASIEITVLDGERDIEKLIPKLKERILKRYSLKSFLESPPKLVAIGDAKVDDK